MAQMKSALLLSGGMDSVAIAFWIRPAFGITVLYGQKAAEAELYASKAVCNSLGIEHHVIETDLSALGSGDMVGRTADPLAPASEWWPFRNQMLITLGAMKAIQVGAKELLIGCLRTDGFHADGRMSFVSDMSRLLSMQEGALTVRAPAIEFSAAELIKVSGVPIDILAWAHSCHVSSHACGMCRGCRKHYETLEELGHAPY
ncbi:7-cyano-7-deazaguanine synthase [Rhodoferax mekongensis]|uniref:7-cyano-7-deazaguanine synthase n=1 Tax=Rhodoferax mekongensis TaxID=3068341 RepID=A0ABZ0AXZ9_9BURK|nr:7-cyano-7-deazaguanine synthase [Rhodoferax sp. TBRC 17307]WNO04008.1 7-cyano-7-deazaguanine synthase [Rhodoferax sp. TBRC 17307]